MDDFAQIPTIGSPALGSLLVGKNLNERKVIHRGRVTAHLQPRIKQVVFLVGLILTLFDLLQLQVVAALLADLGDGHHAELKATRLLVVLHYLLAEPKHVKVEDMGISAVLAVVETEKVKIPHRKIVRIQKAVVCADGVVGDNQAGLHDVDEIGLGVGFQNIEKVCAGETVFISHPVPIRIIAVQLEMTIPMLLIPLLLQMYPRLDGGEVIHCPELHALPKLHFKADPRKKRKLHVVPLEYIKGLVPEHDFLGQCHIRDDGRLLHSH